MMNLKTSGVVLALAALPVTALALTALAQSPTPAPDATKQEARAKFRAACGADVQKFCANIERAKGAMRTCLTAHETDLSDTCKAARAERAAARSKEKS